jgi:beta-lactamase superfamily II metal-dependent hydrolase
VGIAGQYHPPGFAAWATPQVTVISGGQRDILPEVKAAYALYGSRIYHTAEDGAVRVTMSRTAVHVQTWRRER